MTVQIHVVLFFQRLKEQQECWNQHHLRDAHVLFPVPGDAISP